MQLSIPESRLCALNAARRALEQFYGEYEPLYADFRSGSTAEAEWVGTNLRMFVQLRGYRNNCYPVIDEVEVLVERVAKPAGLGHPRWKAVAARRGTHGHDPNRHGRPQYFRFDGFSAVPDADPKARWGDLRELQDSLYCMNVSHGFPRRT